MSKKYRPAIEHNRVGIYQCKCGRVDTHVVPLDTKLICCDYCGCYGKWRALYEKVKGRKTEKLKAKVRDLERQLREARDVERQLREAKHEGGFYGPEAWG